MYSPLPAIEVGKRPVVLFIGNGISRLNGTESWENFIKSIETQEFTKEQADTLKNLPYPMQPIVATGDNVREGMRQKAKNLIDVPVSDNCSSIIKKLAEINPDVILTTNYTYEIEKSLSEDFRCVQGHSCKYRLKSKRNSSGKELNILNQYFKVDDKIIWHIHGEAAKPDTMIIGHYYYGKTLSKVIQYMNGLISRRKMQLKKGYAFQPQSWIDYFMLGDVYTLGYGCSLYEMDFWWLINCKKLNFPDDGQVYVYEPDISPEIRLLAEAYGVNVISAKRPADNEYESYYRKTISEIERSIKDRN